MTTPELIEVVAGIIFDESREQVLLALRKPEQHQGNRWEFPGGKLEASEDMADALLRELEEEIGIRARSWQHRTTLDYTYPEKQVRLHFVDVTAFDGMPVGLEGQTLQWTALAELSKLSFPEANRPVAQALVEEARRRST